jgi:hypothetical protein
MVPDLTPEELQGLNINSWILANRLVTENEKPIDFTTHRCLIQPYSDMSPQQVVVKASQIGWTVKDIIKSAYLCIKYGFNVIYVLPTRTVVKDFVAPKVDKLYKNNPAISEHITKDSENLKQLGKRFIYFRGAFSDTEAISISADLVVGDEYDRSNQKVLETYESRLDASDYGFYWRFSNPSLPGFGVDEMFQYSDQMTWHITCSHCGHQAFIDWEPNGANCHYVKVLNKAKGQEAGYYACGQCDKEIYDADRQNGEWIPLYPGRKVRGYWLSQMMMPYKSAAAIIEKSNGDQDVFYNFTLGKAYQPADMSISRDLVVKNLNPGEYNKDSYCLGVDNGIEKHWVLGNINGMVACGVTEDWNRIVQLIERYKPLTVIDANPYPNMPFKLVKKYPGLVYANYYQEDKDNKGTYRWLQGRQAGIVHTDRTRAFDNWLGELTNNDFTFYMTQTELEDIGYVSQIQNIYRIVKENAQHQKKGYWEHKQGSPDHYAHATIYMNVARSRLQAIEGAGVVRSQPPVMSVPKGVTPDKFGALPHSVDPLEIARKQGKVKRKENRY